MTKTSRVCRLLAATALTSSVLMAAGASAQTAAPTPAPTPTAPVTTPARPVAALGVVTPSWGNIRSLWGNIRSLQGDDIVPLWGNIRSLGSGDPFANDSAGFWGNIRSLGGDVNASWGNIRSLNGDLSASWGNIRSLWDTLGAYSASQSGYSSLAGQLNGMVSVSKASLGSAVVAQTGKSFEEGFANPLFAKYGIDLNNPQSLASLDLDTREHFFVDWYDGLMNFTGRDHVDHWMNEVNWSPKLTQQVGMSGGKSVIGILDFSITGDPASSVTKYSGVSTFANGHGSAVASLIVSAHDGRGIMGIAPSASVISYNPFDASQSSNWTDIKNGVLMLANNNASIVNASLGVPGWTLNAGWNGVFTDAAVKAAVKNKVFVLAAGNDGIVQTQNIAWNKDNPYIIVVGSVDPRGQISSFSNQPGEACLLDGDKCAPGGKIKSRFITAPGELILVSDGAGGVTRLSGTSFAAPLVSGTIALMHDRWPWLASYPKDTTNIIFASAKDLGAPGVDAVYGNGELDVQAALSPLDWNKLTVKQVTNGAIKDLSIKDIQATSAATRATWEANSVYFALFEDTGDSFRDFEVPVSTKLANQTVSVGGSAEQFMGYLTSRFQTWVGAPTKLADGSARSMGFTDLTGSTSRLAGFGDTEATVTMRARTHQMGFKGSQVPFESSVRLVSPDRRFAAEFGNGQSAASVGGQSGFAMASDYDPAVGGANPFVGFASGGAYGKLAMALAPGLTLSSGVTERKLERSVDGQSLAYRQAFGGRTPYRANAATVAVSYQPTGRLTATVNYTMLHEANAVLGMASADRTDLAHGSTTDAATVGAEFALTPSLSLASSATIGRTRSGDPRENNLAVGRSGLVSSAFQVALAKQGLFGAHDNLRLTVAQPMHVERGSVDISSVKVIDREAGVLGVVTQSVDVTAPSRRYVAEMLYGRSMMDGRASVSLFGRANLNAVASDALPAVTAGTSMRIVF